MQSPESPLILPEAPLRCYFVRFSCASSNATYGRGFVMELWRGPRVSTPRVGERRGKQVNAELCASTPHLCECRELLCGQLDYIEGLRLLRSRVTAHFRGRPQTDFNRRSGLNPRLRSPKQ